MNSPLGLTLLSCKMGMVNNNASFVGLLWGLNEVNRHKMLRTASGKVISVQVAAAVRTRLFWKLCGWPFRSLRLAFDSRGTHCGSQWCSQALRLGLSQGHLPKHPAWVCLERSTWAEAIPCPCLLVAGSWKELQGIQAPPEAFACVYPTSLLLLF